MIHQGFFTLHDVALVHDSKSNSAARVAIAERMGYHFHQLSRTSNAFKASVEIALLLQKDRNEAVRAALATSIANENKCPAQLAGALASDASDAVALPVLRQSPKLSDAALLTIIRATEQLQRLMAICERKILSSVVCSALIQKQIEAVCLSLIQRHAVSMDTACTALIASCFADNPVVLHAAHEAFSAMKPANDSAATVSTENSEAAASGKKIDPHTTGLIHWAQEFRRIQQQIDSNEQTDATLEWMALIEQMNREGGLNASTMLLALGLGFLPLFGLCMARQSKLATQESIAACLGSEQDFRMLYLHSHLPAAAQKLCWWGLSSCRELLAKGEAIGSNAFAKAMARKFSQAEKLKINLAQTLCQPVIEALLTES